MPHRPAKDVIIRGSHNIDPQSIEDALTAHPDIEVAAAVRMPDSYAGELPVAFVSLRDGANVFSNDLLSFLKDRIEEPAALPKRIEVIETMPPTPVGKIFKPGLRQKAIHWAIADAASVAGVPSDRYVLEVNDKREAKLYVDQSHIDKFKEGVVGMPISITVEMQPSRLT